MSTRDLDYRLFGLADDARDKHLYSLTFLKNFIRNLLIFEQIKFGSLIDYGSSTSAGFYLRNFRNYAVMLLRLEFIEHLIAAYL